MKKTFAKPIEFVFPYGNYRYYFIYGAFLFQSIILSYALAMYFGMWESATTQGNFTTFSVPFPVSATESIVYWFNLMTLAQQFLVAFIGVSMIVDFGHLVYSYIKPQSNGVSV